jgi:hypothetical protein
MCKLSVALFSVAILAHVAHSQDGPVVPKGPPPRFITVRNVDQAKAEVVFDVQVVVQGVLDRPTVLIYPDGYKRMTLGTKPSYVYLLDGFKVWWKKAKWTGTDGKEVSAESVAKRLKPGVTIVLSADGAAVDEAYLRMFKEDTLVLIVPQEELPVPYASQGGSAIPVQNVDK